LRANVGQTLSSVNPASAVILSRIGKAPSTRRDLRLLY
jgi:hypothetical protein